MLIHINLLPWREQKRKQKKKRIILLIFCTIVLAVLIVLLMHHKTSYLLRNQVIRNQLLQKEIVVYDTQIKEIKNLIRLKKVLISRITLVQRLHSFRILTVHLFDELIKVTPTSIYLSKIQGKNNIISVTGYAQSNTSVSEIIKNIEHDPWFQEPVLNEIKKIDDKIADVENEFKLTFILEAAPDVSN